MNHQQLSLSRKAACLTYFSEETCCEILLSFALFLKALAERFSRSEGTSLSQF
jgi:hypothetical protein